MAGGDSPRAEYRIGKVFYDDHVYRECGQTGEVIEELKNQYVVSLDLEALNDLVSDASYYASANGFIPGLGNLHAAARRTLKALRKQGPPSGYRFKESSNGIVTVWPR